MLIHTYQREPAPGLRVCDAVSLRFLGSWDSPRSSPSARLPLLLRGRRSPAHGFLLPALGQTPMPLLLESKVFLLPSLMT